MNRFGDIDCSFKRLPPVYGFHSEKLVAIDTALQPIELQIKELSRYIKIAKKHCNHPNEHGLSKDQAASIYIYTMEWGETTLYRVLNEALRSEQRDDLKIWFPYLKLFDSALNLLPTVKEVVWRGVPLDIGKNFTKNQMFTWWSVSSCSSSVNVIEAFLQNKNNSTLFLIEVANEKKVSGYTEFENEDEIILRIGTEFRVKSNPLKRPDGSHTVHLIENIDDDDEDEHNKQPLASAMKNLNVKPKLSNQKMNAHHFQLKANIKWNQNAQTIAGGNGRGDKLDQLSSPFGIYVDHQQQAIYIADYGNHCVVQWKLGEDHGQIVAGGSRTDRLNKPADMIVDETNKSLIICDLGNRRVVQCSLEDPDDKQIIIENIGCEGLMMNENEDLFISDRENHAVRRWRKGEIGKGKQGTIVAGGNGKGNKLNQLNVPTFIFVDREETVYVSDERNHRVMKWYKDAKEGIIVAGGQGQGNGLNQFNSPQGLIVNEACDVYVADNENHRVMCWPLGSNEGRIVVGGNGPGTGSNQLKHPIGLSFDVENNLYIAECGNHRIQRFSVDKN